MHVTIMTSLLKLLKSS